jgi:HEAT repeat protein
VLANSIDKLAMKDKNLELDRLAEVVDDLIVQLDYPGFEPRGLRLGLPEDVQRMPTKTFANALGHESIYVRLAALRWFQERPGMAKSYLKAVCGLLESTDEFVRMEAVRTVERVHDVPAETVVAIAKLLQDENVEVRKAAAKAAGKLGSRLKPKSQAVLDALQAATNDANPEVRMKVQKAVRLVSA